MAFGLLLAACGGEPGPTNPGVVAPDTASVAPPDTAAVLPDPRALLADTVSVRAIYAIPTDRAYRSTYVRGIQRALVDLQLWYQEQMLGTRTFRLYSSLPTVCELPLAEARYWTRPWDQIIVDLQGCAPVDTGDFIWVVYADVAQDCFGRTLLKGRYGLMMMNRDGLHGLVDPNHALCGYPILGIESWIGMAGHELGHAFGLPHPPGCEEGDMDVCESDALMWTGLYSWPDTYLRPDELAVLSALPHFSHRPAG